MARRWLEADVYDEVGNIEEMKHQQGTEASPGTTVWHRYYAYATTSNQLLRTSIPADNPSLPGSYSHVYTHNSRGAMTAMPHLTTMTRQFDDQLRSVDLGSGDDAVYHYDARGERVRKVVRLGANTEERVYLGGYEVYRKDVSSSLDTERETLHVMDDQRRVAMVETLTVDGGSTVATPTPRQRLQLDDHLGSAVCEVDEDGDLITYEEYHPYGSTSWWATASGVDVSQKRYRYTGMEKDDETGLARHGVRLYAPWLARWVRADPGGLVDGPNRYRYVGCRPTVGRDSSGRETEQYNMFRGSDQRDILLTAGLAGYSDLNSFYDDLEAVAVDGVAQVQIGDQNVTIGLRQPRSGSSRTSFAETFGINFVAGEGVSAYLNSPLGVVPRQTLQFGASVVEAVPGLTDVLSSDAVKGTAGVLEDAGLLFGLLGSIRYGAGRTTKLLTGPHSGQRRLTVSQDGELSLTEASGGEVSVAREAGRLSPVSKERRSRTHINSDGDEVRRGLVNNQDDLLQAAEDAAGGNLDSFREIKPGWYVGDHPTSGRRLKIEWEPSGHRATNEGPHVTVRMWDPNKGKKGGWDVVEKIFIEGQEKFR